MTIIYKLLRFLHLATPLPVAASEPSEPVKRRRGRPARTADATGTVTPTKRRKQRATRRRVARIATDGTPVKPVRRRRKAARRTGTARKARAVAAPPADPAPGTDLVPQSKGELIVFKAKAITAEQFHDAAQAAKRAARDALGARWDLVEGASVHLMVPSRYRSFKTMRKTRIRCSGDRRYPVAEYWPNGMLPPLVLTVPDYRWAKSRWEKGNIPPERWLTYDGPELELEPEIDVDDERAALAEAAD